MQTALRFGWSEPHEGLHVALRPPGRGSSGETASLLRALASTPGAACAKHGARRPSRGTRPADLTEPSAGGGARTAQREVSSLTGASGSACDSAGGGGRDAQRLGETGTRSLRTPLPNWRLERGGRLSGRSPGEAAEPHLHSPEPANVAEEAERRLKGRVRRTALRESSHP